jgi:hypothetical protein
VIVDTRHCYYILFTEKGRISDTLKCKDVFENFNEILTQQMGLRVESRWQDKEA